MLTLTNPVGWVHVQTYATLQFHADGDNTVVGCKQSKRLFGVASGAASAGCKGILAQIAVKLDGSHEPKPNQKK